MAGEAEAGDRRISGKGKADDQAGVHDKRRAGSGTSTAAVMHGRNVQWHTVSAATRRCLSNGREPLGQEKIESNQVESAGGQERKELRRCGLFERRIVRGVSTTKASEMVEVSHAKLRGRFAGVGLSGE